jgi:uncharacterized protein YqgC (DUF456 family)
MDSGRLQPAFYGGLLIGVLSALPIVSAGNCCCCLWVVAGGMLAVYLRQQNSPYAVTSAEGALVGLLAGVIGAVIGVLISIPLDAMMGPFQRQLVERLINSQPDLPPEMRDAVERASAGGRGVAGLAIKFLFMLITGTIFGMLGGLLGVAVFKKDAPPPPPPGTIEVLPPE